MFLMWHAVHPKCFLAPPKPSGLAILENSGTGASGRLNLLHIGEEINMTVIQGLTPGDACTITSEKNTRLYKHQGMKSLHGISSVFSNITLI